ncbi:MAG: TlpA family protein disulfide reductase [Gammaproteobacteria bacterium]|nr:TlpA family protein disulfide reductase [Gammaproteobacteria bacterium]MCW8986374.1 TlpA family protein disulfide reductase [Gammaproteobacteria bacterium]MCW9031280.1 TlpA family protein disulfide reductase [Gammaproteobacteria bacterium]
MNKLNSTLLMVGMAVAGLTAGYLFNNWQHQQKLTQLNVSTAKETTLSNIRPLFKLKDLDDKVRDVKEWDGQVLMINFWATWCPPCRKEIPAFIKLQEKYEDKGFKIIGIALDEKQAVIDFTDPMGVNYPVLMAEQEGIALSKAYGNRLGVLPFSVIIDRKGNIIHRQRTELSFEQVETMIKPLI